MLARNLSNKKIGLAAQMGEETIMCHVRNLFAKLGARTRKQLVQRGRRRGLLVEPGLPGRSRPGLDAPTALLERGKVSPSRFYSLVSSPMPPVTGEQGARAYD